MATKKGAFALSDERGFLAFLCLLCMLGGMEAQAQEDRIPPPPSLKDVAAPEPPDLLSYVKDKTAAIALGKALFWDMQVGSDDVVSCATCHFNAGADVRTTNQISPGLLSTGGGDTTFGNSTIPAKSGRLNLSPSCELTVDDFPLHRRFPATALVPRPVGPDFAPVVNEFDNVLFDTNDVVSSKGVRWMELQGLRGTRRSVFEVGAQLFDPVFNLPNPRLAESPRQTLRRVEPRNAPTTINAVFNFENFLDGRASAIFNGVNPFGFRDRNSTLRKGDRLNPAAPLTEEKVRIINSSLASQAVGPPLSDFEMSFANRTFPLLGRKLLASKPLAKQLVHPEDSVLGPLSQARVARNGRVLGRKGLKASSYAEMIRDAFQDEWWNSTQPVAGPGGPYTQMEWNFSLYFGLAVQLYEATLIADDTPFDRFMGSTLNVRGGGIPIPPDPTALTPQELLGLDIFQRTNLSGLNPTLVDGGCLNCHALPETTNHTPRILDVHPVTGIPGAIIEFMRMGDGLLAAYDTGFYNVGVRPTDEDRGRAETAPFVNPETGLNFPLSYVELAKLNTQNLLPPDVAAFVPNRLVVPEFRTAVEGTFKTPNLRNVQFTGPYFHQGGDATLRQAVEFYARGGNFPCTNFANLDEDIEGVPGLDTSVPDPVLAAAAEERIQALVAFLSRGLTDERVQFDRAPFDHPELLVPEGTRGRNAQRDTLVQIPAVGRNGRSTEIPRFLGLDPQTP